VELASDSAEPTGDEAKRREGRSKEEQRADTMRTEGRGGELGSQS